MNNNIEVQIQAEYLPQESRPDEDTYVFAYHVAVTNHNDRPAQLLSRSWIITDGEQKVREVKGKGVVGEQPWIQPGETYRYSSGSVLETPVGSMHGSYHMKWDDNTEFDADIPVFTLAQPEALH